MGGTSTIGANGENAAVTETTAGGDVAVLFTDMEGSTEVSSARGDEQAMELLRVHEVVVRSAAAARAGRVIKSTGDGFLVAFRDPSAAVATALDVRAGLAAHNAKHPGDPVLVRMGINAGPVIEEGGDLYGLAVNAGARIAAKAATGQVLVSEAIRDRLHAATTGWTFIDRGTFWLKGIRDRWRLFEVTDGSPAEPATQVRGLLPFVDRDAERALLRRHVDAANDGRGRLVLVRGVAGSGKTRLSVEIGDEARSRGLRFVVGRCHEHADGTSYAPIVEIVDALTRELAPDVLRVTLGEGAPNIAELVPSLAAVLPEVRTTSELPVQEARSALFVSIRDVFANLAATRPMVVLVDDLHWADEATLHLISYLAEHLASLPVLVVATYSDDEVATNSPLRTMLSVLHRQRALDAIPVTSLGEADVAELLSAFAKRPAPPALVALLHEATAGNPFFIEEVLRHLVDHDRLFDAHGDWRADVDPVEVDVPDSVRFAIENRLSQLQPTTRSVLTMAAVVGRDVPYELLDAITDVDEDALLDALDDAEHRGILSSIGDGDGGDVRFAFAHGLIRRALLADVSLTRRQRLHMRVADALEVLDASQVDDHAADIAFHLGQAGRWADPGRTRSFLLRAGERALRTAAFEEALRHFDKALALAPADSTHERATLLERMAIAERSLGHLDDALSLWNEALGLLDELDARTDVARVCLDAAIQVAWWRRGREVIDLVERGLAALGDDDVASRAGLLALAGGVASQQGSFDQATRLLDEALAIAERHGDEGMLGLTLYSQAVHHFAHNEYPKVIASARASLDYLRRAGDAWNVANVLGYLGTALGWTGEFDEADRVGAEAAPYATRLGNWSAYVFADGARAFKAIGSQPAVEVLEHRGDEVLALGERLGYAWLTSIGHARKGLAAFWRGEWDTALANMQRAADEELRNASGGHQGRLFLLHAYLGNAELAGRLIDEARPAFAVVGRPNSGRAWTLTLTAVEAFAMLGDFANAARLYPAVVAHQDTGSLMRSWDYRLISTLAGIAAGAAHEWDIAEAHFLDARRQARELPLRHEEPDVCRFHAIVLRLRGEPDDIERAGTLLTEALAMYESFGMPRHAALTRDLLADAR